MNLQLSDMKFIWKVLILSTTRWISAKIRRQWANRSQWKFLHCAVGSVSDSVEWLICMKDVFFELRSLNGSMLYNHSFCESKNTLQILKRIKDLTVQKFRRRHPGAVLNEKNQKLGFKWNSKFPYGNKPRACLEILDSPQTTGNFLSYLDGTWRTAFEQAKSWIHGVEY